MKRSLSAALRDAPFRRGVVWLIIATFVLSPYGVLAAPVPDAAAGAQKPTVTNVGAVPVVTITTPNAKGVSHNKYSAFDVTASGVVLNNATAPATTVLAGPLAANPNLGPTPARTILNEVTSSASSLLAGKLEVAGSAAKLIVANPNGITCNGCGFINTPHVQLAAGEPQQVDGAMRFYLRGGVINIGQDGLSALATRLDLIARRNVLAGPVAVGELNVLGGRAFVDSETLNQEYAGFDPRYDPVEQSPADEYFIDIGQSVKAGTVRLLVSWNYAGGRNGIRATAPVEAVQDVTVFGSSSVQLDDVRAGRNIGIFSPGYPWITLGKASAGDTLQVLAQRVYNPEGGLWQSGNDTQIGVIGFQPDDWSAYFNNRGTIQAGRDLLLSTGGRGGHINTGLLRAQRDVLDTSRTGSVINFWDGFPLLPEIAALKESRAKGFVPYQQRALSAFWPRYGTFMNGDAVGEAGTLQYGRVEAGRNASLPYKDRLGGGSITVANDLELWSAQYADLHPPSGGTVVKAGRDIWLYDHQLSGGGQLSAGRDVHMVATASDRRDGVFNDFNINAGGNIVARTDYGFANQGALSAVGAIEIAARQFTNQPSVVIERGRTSSPRHPGCLTDKGGYCDYSDEVLRWPGILHARQDITITADKFSNVGGNITADGNIDIRTTNFENRSRVLSSTWTGTYYETAKIGGATSEPPASGSSGSGGSASSGGELPKVQHTVSGTTPNIGEISAVIQAGGRFTVAGIARPNIDPPPIDAGGTTPPDAGNPSTPPSGGNTAPDTGGAVIPPSGGNGTTIPAPLDPPPTQSFVNTGHIGAGVIVVRADEIRNGYDPIADYYRRTAVPTGSPLVLDTAVDGGQMIADMALVIEAEKVVNTGYMASGGLLAMTADSLWSGKRNAEYNEVRKVKGGTLTITGDTVQPGGVIAASAFDLKLDSLYSRSGEFIVLQGEHTVAASNAFVATLAASLGENYVSEEAVDHLNQHFKAKKKKRFLGGLGGFIVAAVVSYLTVGAASSLLAEMVAADAGLTTAQLAAAHSTWAAATATAEAGLANFAVSQGIGSLLGSAAGQFAADGHVDWALALRSGLTAGVTSGLTSARIFDNRSLNQLANVQTVGGQALGIFNPDTFASNVLGIAGRSIVTAGVSSAINGTSFDHALRQSIVRDLAAVGANAIGQTWGPLATENVMAHAALGCAAAAAGGGNCEAGAVGAAIAAVVNPLIDPLTGDADPRLRTIEHLVASMTASGLLADAMGLDSITAAAAAQNETVNNYLSYKEAALREQLIRQIAACTDDNCRQSAQKALAAIDDVSRKRNEAIASACKSPSSAECAAWNTDLQAAMASYTSNRALDIGSVGRARDEALDLATLYEQRISNAAGFNLSAGAATSLAVSVLAAGELVLLSGKSLIGDAQAQDALKKVANGVGDFLADPVGTVEKDIKTRIDRANELDALGRTDEATQIRSQLVTDGLLTATGIGTLAIKGTGTVIKLADNALTAGIDAAYLRSLKLDAGTIKGFRSADEVNALMKSAEWSPAWKSGSSVVEATLQPGTKVRMVVDENTIKALTDPTGKADIRMAFGGWGTFDDVPTQSYARNQLAITPDMKAAVGYVIEVEITKPVNAHVGVVGSQKGAVGGGNQLHFIVSVEDRTSAFKYVDGSARSLQ